MQRSLLFLGLANGGKTTLVNCLKPTKDGVQEVVPTVGYGIEKFTLHKCKVRRRGGPLKAVVESLAQPTTTQPCNGGTITIP